MKNKLVSLLLGLALTGLCFAQSNEQRETEIRHCLDDQPGAGVLRRTGAELASSPCRMASQRGEKCIVQHVVRPSHQT